MGIADMSEERYQYVGMVLDEVHFQADLVYDKQEGALIGFVNFGEGNNHLLQFENALYCDVKLLELANSMVVILVRTLFYKLNFLYV